MMAGERRPFVVGPGAGRFIELGEFGMTVKADADATAGIVSVLESEEPPGFGPPIHVQLNFYFPAAMIGYFDDLAAALGRDAMDEDGLAEIARTYAMEIVGPPADRYV
jgi:hypothetical protein